jgi:glycosyltransferase involved in cell wall biosynthesis
LKILHVITGLNDGGAESALYRLCKHDQLNSHIVVSMMGQGKYGPLLQEIGVRVICLGMPQGRVTLNGLFQLWRSIRESKPDVVQTWLYHADLIGGVVSRLAGVVNVFWGVHHSNLSPGTVKGKTIVVAKICSIISSWVPKNIVCCSQSAVEIHVALGYSREKFRVVPNGYDLSDFKPNLIARESVRASLKIDPRVTLLGMVARYDIQKDHGNLFGALRLLKESEMEFH